jgi:hypothetical protein
MLATTKLVRKIVRSINNGAVYGNSYTDITKANNNLRNVTFFVYKHSAEAIATELRIMLKLLGYANVVKVTTSKEIEQGFLRGGGNTYLRINNCILD